MVSQPYNLQNGILYTSQDNFILKQGPDIFIFCYPHISNSDEKSWGIYVPNKWTYNI